jgi:hypothetical protein
MKAALLFLVVLCSAGFISAQSQPPTPSPSKGAQVKQQKSPNNEAATEVKYQLLPTPSPQPSAPSESQHGAYDEKAAPSVWSRLDPNWVIAIFTVVIAGATVAQVRVYKRQAALMESGLNETKKTADAALKSANAANATVKLMGATAEKQLRAYIGINLAANNPPTPPNNIKFCMINRGQTPAFNVTNFVSWYSFAGANTPWQSGHPYTRYGSQTGSKFTLFPQDPSYPELELKGLPGGPAFSQLMANAAAGLITLYIYGEVSYFDLFGKKERITEFCYRQRVGVAGQLEVCDHHNHAT